MDWGFIVRWLSIVVLDLTLAGDNAVVIAMAVRSLPAKQQKTGIFWGAGAAIVLRVVVTFIAAQLLMVPLLQFGGGVLLLWIAWKLLRQPPGAGEHHFRSSSGLWEAVKIIALADFIMSTDNMLAVAAASHGNFFLLMFGLGLSIPIIMFCSAMVAKLMNKYPWLVLLGAAILGWVAGEMIVADRLVGPRLGDLRYAVERTIPILLAVAVVVVGRWGELTGKLRARRHAAAARSRSS